MVSAGILFDPLPLMDLKPCEYNIMNIMLFSVLMMLVLKPWFAYDKYLLQSNVFIVNEKYVELIKKVFIITIVLSAYSIVYALPYVIFALSIGAENIRNIITDAVVMPKTIYTTLAVGISTFTPVTIVFFYVSLLDSRFKRYRFLLVLSSLSYIITSMTQAARDGFIFTTLTYIVFFLVFRNSLEKEMFEKVKRTGFIIGGGLLLFFMVLTISRFGDISADNKNELLYGTWGYIYQQPYVFDHVLEQFNGFYGFNRRMHFLSNFFDIEGRPYTSATQVEYMFGTQFGEYYEISGYSSLFIGLIVYISLFYSIITYHMRRCRHFSAMLAFVIYVYFTLSGIFYFRFGGNDSEFLFYMGILCVSFISPDFIEISSSSDPIKE